MHSLDHMMLNKVRHGIGSIDVDMCGTKLLPTTASAYPVDCVSFCNLLETQHYCLSFNSRYNQAPSAIHPIPMYMLQLFTVQHC